MAGTRSPDEIIRDSLVWTGSAVWITAYAGPIDFPHENPTRCEIDSEHECRVRKSLYRNNWSPKGVGTLKQRKGARRERDWVSCGRRCVIGGTLKTARFQGGHIAKSSKINGDVRSIVMDAHTAEIPRIENFE